MSIAHNFADQNHPDHGFAGNRTQRIFSGPPEPGDLPVTAGDLDIALAEFRPQPRKENTMANPNETPNYDKAQGGSLAVKGIAAVKETPYSRLCGAVDRLRKASTLVTEVGTKLCGDQPEAKREACTDGSPGIFGDIEKLADAVIDLADDITGHALRIGNRL